MTAILFNFQKHRFVLIVVSAAFLGLCLAFFVSVALQYYLRSGPAESPIGAVESIPRQMNRKTFQPLEAFEALASGSFFRESGGGRKENDEPEANLTLLGVIAGSEQFARAAVQFQGKNEVIEVRVGQTIGGFQIGAIGSNFIMVLRGTNQIRIGIGGKSGEARQEPFTEPKGPSTPQKIIVSRDKLNAVLADPTQMLRAKMALIPLDKKIVGIRLLLIPTDHFLFEMGARTGDIVRRYNGQPVDSMEKMIQIFNGLKTANRAAVEVERAGRVLPFEIIVQ